MDKTKQVVIKGLKNKNYLLTPYWILEYYKRKGKQIHCYIGDWENNIKLYTQEELKNYIECSDYVEYFTTKKVNNIDELNLLTEKELFGLWDFEHKVNREDKILIQIAKEINDEEQLKIIEIPYDVEYDIREYEEVFCGEYICEKHRIWN